MSLPKPISLLSISPRTYTCGGASDALSDGSAKNGPDAEHLMKETTPKKEGSTKRLCESVGCVNTDAVVCIKHSYNASPQVDEDAENGEIDVAVCLLCSCCTAW